MKGTPKNANGPRVSPKMSKVHSVPGAKNLRGQTGKVSASKSSKTAAFGASKRAGSVKGDC